MITPEKWLEIWQSVRKIEDAAKLIAPVKGGPRYDILVEVSKLKGYIQREAGPLEY